MNSSYIDIDRINYVGKIDPIYSYQRCYKHVAMGVANDSFVHRSWLHPNLNSHEVIFEKCLQLFHSRLSDQWNSGFSLETHLKSKAYQKAKKLIFERMAKLFRDEDTPYANDMCFKAELILATQFSRKSRHKRSGE